MHELSLTQAIVEAIEQRMPGAQISAVRLEIGKLSGVVVDSIRFCFDLVAEGTALQGARLEIDEPSGDAACRDCGARFGTDDPIVLCPCCAGADVEVRSGAEFRIISVEVNPTCAPPAAAPTTAECG